MTEEVSKVLTKIAKDQAVMSSASLASNVAKSIRDRAVPRLGNKDRAYEFIARHIGRSKSWVRGLVAQKYSRIDHDIFCALDALLKSELQSEMVRLTHEMEMAHQCGLHPCSKHVAEIETQMEKLKALMNGEG